MECTLDFLLLVAAVILTFALAGASQPSESRQRGVIFKSFQAIKPFGRGDDSLYISSRSDDAGVFDGVGSWTDLGIDCSKYTKALSKEVVKGINEQRQKEGGQDMDLIQALEFGMDKISAEDINYSGSTTVCMASLNTESRVLSLLNIGDSGCMLFRRRQPGKNTQDVKMYYELVMATHPMVIGYNAPFQVGHLSGQCRNTFSLYGDENGEEPPSTIKTSPVSEEPLTEEKQSERLRKLKELSGVEYRNSGGQDRNRTQAVSGGVLRRDSAQVLARQKTLQDLVRRHERSNLFSSVREADTYEVVVRAGDVIVLGTDGMWDNVFLSEVLDVLNSQLGKGPLPPNHLRSEGDARAGKEEAGAAVVQAVVDLLSKRALSTVFNRNKASPFTLARLAYLRQKPSLESVIGNLLRTATGGGGGKEGARRNQRERGRGRLKAEGRDFAASYESLDLMARTADWTPQEEGQLRKEKAFGGKVDDVTIVVGLVVD